VHDDAWWTTRDVDWAAGGSKAELTCQLISSRNCNTGKSKLMTRSLHGASTIRPWVDLLIINHNNSKAGLLLLPTTSRKTTKRVVLLCYLLASSTTASTTPRHREVLIIVLLLERLK
jgi:hypothetical protein